ncbi:hypothetical protein ACQY0O_005676 [Thecaphora frezii]
MLANPPIMSRHSRQTFPSWESGRPLHATYAAPAPGPSNYAQQQQQQQAQHHQQQQQQSPWSPSAGPSSQPINAQAHKDAEQPLPTPTAVITADGTTVYAATGRKRKRLQKACVACHKAKRRCDGGLPCSNCDFSGRTCCYSDASGKMVLPTARAGPSTAPAPIMARAQNSPDVPSSQQLTHTQPHHVFVDSRANANAVTGQDPNHNPSNSNGAGSNNGGVKGNIAPSNGALPGRSTSGSVRPSFAHSSLSPSRSPKLGASLSDVSNLADIPPERRRELISIFFTQLHPFSSVIDEISFLRDLSTSEVSPALLFAMFALAARFQQNVDDHYRFAAGEAYARSARMMLSEEDGDGASALERPSLETATTLCFLAAHEAGMGRLQRALLYSSASVRMVVALKFHEGAIPEARQLPYSRDSFSSNARRNSCQRLVCVSWALDILVASLSGQVPSARADEIDASLAIFRTSNSDDVSRAYFSMAQIFGVFARVLDHARAMRTQQQSLGGGKGLDAVDHARAREGVRSCEDSLHAWAEQLTAEEKFDEANLSNTSKALAEVETGAVSDKAGCWAMMHMMAECSMFVLHSSTPVDDDQSRQLAAYTNLLLILESFGAAGRQNLFAFPALLICTEHPIRPKPDVSRWWSQARECWALSEAQLGEAAQGLCIYRQSSSPALSLPLPSTSDRRNGAHRHHALPRHHASASGSMLPSLSSLPLPTLRLSPPTSNGTRPESHEPRPSLSPIGLVASPTDLPSWKQQQQQQQQQPPSPAHTQRRASPSSTDPDAGKSPTQAGSFELYALQPTRSPPPSLAMRSGTGQQLGAPSDPRSAWSPITSLRGEKRSISNITQ